MIARRIVHGPDRGAAISRLSRALAGFAVGGVETTIPFHQAVLASPDFAEGRVTTRWVEETFMKQGFSTERAA